MPLASEVRRGSRLGRAVATFIEQVPGQHGDPATDGQTIVCSQSAWVPDGPGSETHENRATTEARSTVYVPRGLPDIAAWVCTVVPGPENADGTPRRLAVAGPAQPYWRRNRSFSHTQVPLRDTTS